jgi:hypothetical protein
MYARGFEEPKLRLFIANKMLGASLIGSSFADSGARQSRTSISEVSKVI